MASLFDEVNDRHAVPNLLNDITIYARGYLTWTELIETHNISEQAQSELAQVVQYWQGIVDAEPDPATQELLRLKANANLSVAFLACDRERINEQEFYEIIGIAPAARRND